MAEAMTPALYKRGAESQGNQLIIDLPKARVRAAVQKSATVAAA